MIKGNLPSSDLHATLNGLLSWTSNIVHKSVNSIQHISSPDGVKYTDEIHR